MVWNNNTGIKQWDNYGINGLNSSNKEYSSNGAVPFSEKIITLGSTDAANPLPVEFVDFTAKYANEKVALAWATASELNNDYFEVQRSTDGATFEVIGKVKGTGNSNSVINYDYTDHPPLSGLVYYRLRQVDFDGQFEFSDIVSVIIPVIGEPLQAYIVPNPTTKDDINVQVITQNQESKVTISLADLYGHVLLNFTKDASELHKGINLKTISGLPAGIYIILIQQDNQTVRKRVIVKE